MIAAPLIALVLAANAPAPDRHDLFWARPQVVESPDHRWRLVVPRLKGADQESVSVRLESAVDGRGYRLWDFDRSAGISWRADGGALLIVTEYPVRGHIGLVEPGVRHATFEADKVIEADMRRRLPKGMEFLWYYPLIVGWDADGSAIFTVGTTIVPKQGGSGREGECRIFHLKTAPVRIVQSTAVPRAEWGRFCPAISD